MLGRPGQDEWRQLLAGQVREHSRLWFRLAFNVLRDAQAAEDVCQQALLRALTQRESIRDPRMLKSWMARTVVNESLTLLRRRGAEGRALTRQAQMAPTQTTADTTEDREAVMAGLATLPEDIRTVVALRVMEGVSGNEVKDLLGCSAGQVSRMLHEGLDRLRRVLQDQGSRVER